MTLDHDTAQQWLLRQRDGALSPDQQQVLEQHLFGCEQCRAVALQTDAWQMMLDIGLQARYAGTVSAETRQNQQRLKQQLTTTKRFAFSPWPAFSTGLIAFFIVVGLLTQLSLSRELTVTTTSSAVVIIDQATATATATLPVVVITVAPPPTPTDIPISKLPPQAMPSVVATSTSLSISSTLPAATSIAVEPTEAAQAVVGEPPPLMLDLLYFLHNRSDWRADEREALFSEQIIYTTRSTGELQLSNQEMMRELGHLYHYVSWFRLFDCTEQVVQPSEGQIHCQITMENEWRAAFRFEPYQGTLTIHFDVNTQRITRFTDLQHAQAAEEERAIVSRFVDWYNATQDGERLTIDVNASPRLSSQRILVNDVLAWVRAGRP